MNDLDKRGSYAISLWEQIRKSGGPAPSLESIENYLSEDVNTDMISREELRSRILKYFDSLIVDTVDHETGENVRTWVKAPSKNGLSIALGISTQTLADIVRGGYAPGVTYKDKPNTRQIISTNDRDLIVKAFQLIEEFYEGQLAINKNHSGEIFWLLNANRSVWTNEEKLTLSAENVQNGPEITRQEIAMKYNAVLLPPEGADNA